MSTVRLDKSQEGVVSLLVTMVLMIVVSLIALGFAQVARNNQGQQLNQQLSTQAFYAAESGVNDASEIISTALSSSTPPSGSDLNRTTCTDDPGYKDMYVPLQTSSYNVLNQTDNVEYTCILVNGDPSAIQTDIGTTSKIIPINASSDISSIKLSWSTEGTSSDPTAGCPTTAKLPQAAAFDNCGIGVLRVDLLPVDGTAISNASASTLADETLTFFAVPTPGGAGASISYDGPDSSTANDDNLIPAGCVNTIPNCTVTIVIPAAYQTHEQYDMRVSSEYEGSDLAVTAASPTNPDLPLTGAQVLIDATGKAENVVRRIQVYVPIGIESNQLSDYAIESTDSICKRFMVMQGSTPTNGYYASGMNGVGVNANNTALDPLC